jgi:sugar transferase (PEP-CTERM/EpsH1 system associated)
LTLLFLANRFPYPPFRGDKLKIFHLAKRLAAKGHTLHLLTFLESDSDRAYIPELQQIFEEIHLVKLPRAKSLLRVAKGVFSEVPFQVLYFRSPQMQYAVTDLLRKNRYDAVHVQHLRMAPYLAQHREIPRLLDLPDAFSLYWKRRMNIPGNPVKKRLERSEYERVYSFEKEMIDAYDRVLTCSAEDQQFLQTEHRASNLALLPNGVDLEQFGGPPHDYSGNKTLLFTGNMDYAPNVDAVLHFAQDIFPLILQHHPDAKFVIAGQRPVKTVQALASDRITVTGFIDDLATMYREASVLVAPLRFGAGTQNKVLEAMAMGVPVVCSQVGFNGLGIADGQGAFMRTEAPAFAQQVVALLDSEALRQQTGEAGQVHVRNQFGWDAIAEKLETYLTAVANR